MANARLGEPGLVLEELAVPRLAQRLAVSAGEAS